MTLQITTKIVSEFEQNARVLVDTEKKESIIIDPGANVKALHEIATQNNVFCKIIFLTHCHIDHGGGVADLLQLFESTQRPTPNLIYHSEEKMLARSIEFSAKMYGLEGHYKNVPQATTYCDHLAEINCGNYQIKLCNTPGHAPGHVSLFIDSKNIEMNGDYADLVNNGLIIGGDTLFKGSIGRTDLPMGNHDQLIQSIKNVLFQYPDDTLVATGHGPNTSIGDEKKNNPFLV